MTAKDKIPKGSLRRVPRANGRWAWEWRYYDPATGEPQSKYLPGIEFPTKPQAVEHLKPFFERLDIANVDREVLVDPTVGDLLDHFIEEENLLAGC